MSADARAPLDRRRWATAAALFIPTWFVVLASLPGIGEVLWRARLLVDASHERAPELLAASFAIYLPLVIAYVAVVRRRFEREDVAHPALLAGLWTLPFAGVFLFVLRLANAWIDHGSASVSNGGAARVAGAGALAAAFALLAFAPIAVPLGAGSAWVMARFARGGDERGA